MTHIWKGLGCVRNQINMQKLLESKGSTKTAACFFFSLSQKHLSPATKICLRNTKVVAGWRAPIHSNTLCDPWHGCLWTIFEVFDVWISNCAKSFFFSSFRSALSFHQFSLFRVPRLVFISKVFFLVGHEAAAALRKMTKINTPHRFGLTWWKTMSNSTMCDICAGTVDVQRNAKSEGKT